jgi:hypothetical protein
MASKKIREKKYVSIGGPRSEGHERKKNRRLTKANPRAHIGGPRTGLPARQTLPAN